MNNGLSVQPLNFRMAYKKGDMKQIAKFLNNQKPEDIYELNKKMEVAVQELKRTRFADAKLVANDEGTKLYHEVIWRRPYFKEDGTIGLSPHVLVAEDIESAVTTTLKIEEEMAAAMEYARQQAKTLESME